MCLVEETIGRLPCVLLSILLDYTETENDRLSEFLSRNSCLNFYDLFDVMSNCFHVLPSLREDTPRFYVLVRYGKSYIQPRPPNAEEEEQIKIITQFFNGKYVS